MRRCFFGDEVEEITNKFDLGRFLTEKSLNVRAVKSKIADIWRPARGINTKDLKPGISLFQFYHVKDMNWVMNGGPWSFDGAMLVISTIGKGEDHVEVPLFDLAFWVQLHGLPNGFMTESAGKQLGDFLGTFLQYDPNNNTSIWRECMRIKIDVRKPLKRKKKICRRNGSENIVQCKYERLGDFCFTCGLVTHTERFCSIRLQSLSPELVREWGVWLRAPSRRSTGPKRSRWLRDEKDDDWGVNHGTDNYYSRFSGEVPYEKVSVSKARSDLRIVNTSPAIIPGSGSQLGPPRILEAKFNFENSTGPSEGELTGLNMDERKKRRRGPGLNEFMDVEGGNVLGYSKTALSGMDCAVSSPDVLAKLALQAIQPQ